MKIKSELAISVFVLLFQIACAFIISLSLYMLSAIINYQGDFDNFVALAVFHPIIALIICSIVIIMCLIIGLPIRLSNKLNNWWRSRFYISLLGISIGLVLMIVAYFPSLRESVHSEEGILVQIPNSTISILGFFIVTFFILHLFPPTFIHSFLNRLVSRFSFVKSGPKNFQ